MAYLIRRADEPGGFLDGNGSSAATLRESERPLNLAARRDKLCPRDSPVRPGRMLIRSMLPVEQRRLPEWNLWHAAAACLRHH